MDTLADAGPQVACAVCSIHPLCHQRAAASDTPGPVDRRRRVPAGKPIHPAGAPGGEIYALRAGMAWMAVLDPCHGRHILRILLPGDLAGLEALGGGPHTTEAVALEDAEVCVVPTERLETMARQDQRVGAHLRELLAAAARRSDQHAASLARLPGAARVAELLLDLSHRWQERGYSGGCFRLPLGQREIGEHLNLTGETVNRVLSHFRARGWIRTGRREVQLLQPEALREVLRSPAVAAAATG